MQALLEARMKVFFSETKNQKTLDYMAYALPYRAHEKIKSFLVLSCKKELLS
jgi:hypothetical protein